jgi:hypothetical protein
MHCTRTAKAALVVLAVSLGWPGTVAEGAMVDKVKALCIAEHPEDVKMQFVCFKLELLAMKKIVAGAKSWPKNSPEQGIAVRCLHRSITEGNQVKYSKAVACIEEGTGKPLPP